MDSKHKTAVIVIVTVLAVIAAVIGTMNFKRDRAAAQEKFQAAKISTAVERIQQANIGLPELQVQAKAIMFTALIQKKIPLAPNWCETLNVDGKLWPATPTNIFFAMNSAVAGGFYPKTSRPPADVVVFFEMENPGWNAVGGSEMMASRRQGVTVAFADGRA